MSDDVTPVNEEAPKKRVRVKPRHRSLKERRQYYGNKLRDRGASIAKLIELDAPQVIIQSELRMIAEAVSEAWILIFESRGE